jgi:nucleoside-diphosphate-sugar epimerase
MAASPQLILLGTRSFLGQAMPHAFRKQFSSVIALSSQDCDLTDPAAVHRCAAAWALDAFVLFTAVVNKQIANDAVAYERNLRMASNLATALRSRPLGGFIFLGSADVYGIHPPVPLREDSPTAPDSFYGRAKLDAEKLLAAELAGRMPLAIFRCPGIFDLTPADHSVVGRFFRTARTDGEITLFNQGRNRRDFIYAPDLYELFARWIAQPVTGLWNAATGESQTMVEIARAIVAAAGSGSIALRESDQRDFDLCFDCAALRAQFGGTPLRPFAETLPLAVSHLAAPIGA